MSVVFRVLAALIMALTGAIAPVPATASAALGPAVFFTPHQDDETLFMGAAIIQHVRAGRKVYVVLLTNGGASAVSSLYPSRAVFVAERDREFVAAVTHMGAIPVIPSGRAMDGTLTAAYANWIMSGYYYAYPGVSLKTTSEYDVHPDHAAAGRGLRQVGYADSRWYSKPEEWATTPKAIAPTGYENVQQSFLDYTPVGWLSAGAYFRAGFIASQNGCYR